MGPTLRASALVQVVRNAALAGSDTATPEAAMDEEPLTPDQLSPLEASVGRDGELCETMKPFDDGNGELASKCDEEEDPFEDPFRD